VGEEETNDRMNNNETKTRNARETMQNKKVAKREANKRNRNEKSAKRGEGNKCKTTCASFNTNFVET
jgi:hypothetical protein